jgi:hypothetical protein
MSEKQPLIQVSPKVDEGAVQIGGNQFNVASPKVNVHIPKSGPAAVGAGIALGVMGTVTAGIAIEKNFPGVLHSSVSSIYDTVAGPSAAEKIQIALKKAAAEKNLKQELRLINL